MAELDPYGFSLGEIYVDDKEAVLVEAGDLINSVKLGYINKSKFEKLINSIGENQYGEYLKKIVNGV